MEERIQSIKSVIFIGGVIPSICIFFFVLLEPHLLRTMCVLLSGYLAIFLILVLLMLRKQFEMKKINLLKNILVSLCSMLIILIVVELTFYYKYRDESIGAADTPSGITFYPKYYKENRFGFRDREIDTTPPVDTKRILVLGDSFTYGMGIKNGNNSYPKVLERMLNTNSKNEYFEVINAGKKGYNTSQEYDLLKTIGIGLNPDLIILGYYKNDTEPDNMIIPILGNEPDFIKTIDKKLCQRFFSWYIFRTKMLPNFKKLNNQYNSLITSQEVFSQHEIIFKELVDFLKEKDIPLVVLIIPPSCYKKDKNEFTEKSLIHIRKLCDKYKLMCIDLAPIMEELAQQYSCIDLLVNKYDSHPSELVHRVYAQQVFDFLMGNMVNIFD